MRAEFRSLARASLLIALVGGTLQLPGASWADFGVRHGLEAVHSLSPEHCCADVAEAASHDEHRRHACAGTPAPAQRRWCPGASSWGLQPLPRFGRNPKWMPAHGLAVPILGRPG